MKPPWEGGTPGRPPFPSRLRGEEGQVGVLIIGYLVVSLLVLSVVLAATSVYLGHKRLLSVADGAALAAADSFTIGTGHGGGTAPVLEQGTVATAVHGYLEQTSASARFHGLQVGPGTGTPDGRTAQVALTAVVHPPMVNILVPDGVPIAVTANARSELTR